MTANFKSPTPCASAPDEKGEYQIGDRNAVLVTCIAPIFYSGELPLRNRAVPRG
jgi:hypothetical protein